MIQNNSFENTNECWIIQNGNYSNETKINGSKALKLNGIPYGNSYAKQTVKVNLPSTQTFNLSGWAKANSVNTSNDKSKKFELKAIVNYSNAETQTFTAQFNSDSTEWQYISLGIVPTPTVSSAKVSSIDVYCIYDNNANTAYFDFISLTLEEARKYEYNDKGNLTSINAIEKLEGKNTYDSTGLDITSTTLPTGEVLTFSYNSAFKHVVSSVRSSNGTTNSFTYDSFGNLTSSTYSAQMSSESITTYTRYTSPTSYSSVYIDYTIDERGYSTDYDYNSASGLLNYVRNANNHQTSYAYDNLKRITAVYEDTDCDMQIDANERKVQYTYANNMLQYIMTASTNYKINYDYYGNTECVLAGNNTLVWYEYETKNGKLIKTTYGNGRYIENVYDYLDRIIGIKYNGDLKFTFTYNANNRLCIATDKINGKIYTYDYDKYGRLVSAVERTSSGTYVMGIYNKFDELGRPTEYVYLIPGNIMRYRVTYNEINVGAPSQFAGTIKSLSLPEYNRSINYGYDPLQRLTSKNISNVLNTSYTYLPGAGTNKTTTLISSVKLISNNGSTTTYSYTYDNVGNILTVSENDEKHIYKYDALNQLTSDTWISSAGIIETKYEYDKAGNILSQKVYSGYTGELLETKSFSYQNSSWGDLLTSYNGTKINYDEIGNPTNWKNMYYLSWSGRQLNHIFYDPAPLSGIIYEYNSDGIRTFKNIYNMNTGLSVLINYTLDGSKIIQETRSNLPKPIYYYYYESGSVIGLSYNNEYYYFGKNAQGDITKIYNTSGTEVVSYKYNAWGNILSITGSLASTIGELNPFRYRGYYYDSETGLYWLQSRYYDPEIGRFINADDTDVLGVEQGSLLQYNLFAYCLNNPVNRTDDSGYLSMPNWLKVTVGAVATVAAVAVTVATGGAAAPILIGVATSTLSGAAIG